MTIAGDSHPLGRKCHALSSVLVPDCSRSVKRVCTVLAGWMLQAHGARCMPKVGPAVARPAYLPLHTRARTHQMTVITQASDSISIICGLLAPLALELRHGDVKRANYLTGTPSCPRKYTSAYIYGQMCISAPAGLLTTDSWSMSALTAADGQEAMAWLCFFVLLFGVAAS